MFDDDRLNMDCTAVDDSDRHPPYPLPMPCAVLLSFALISSPSSNDNELKLQNREGGGEAGLLLRAFGGIWKLFPFTSLVDASSIPATQRGLAGLDGASIPIAPVRRL